MQICILSTVNADLPNLLDGVPLSIYREMWFQQDGCPAHYARAVRNYLNEEYLDKWIGCSGSILWPPRSPDLNPVDFFLLGMHKRKSLFKTNTKSVRTSPENLCSVRRN